MTAQSRNPAVDVAKGLGIVLVVFGHNWIVQRDVGELYRVIFSFHMPLFFFLSGVFLAPHKDFGQTLRQKADSLLKPYAVVLLLLALRYSIPPHAITADYFLGMLYATGRSIVWIPLWFLPALFAVQIAAILLLRMPAIGESKRLQLSIVVALLLIGVPLLRLGHDLVLLSLEVLPGLPRRIIGLPWSLDMLPINLAFLLAGDATADYARHPERLKPLHGGLIAGGLALLHGAFDATLNMNGRIYDSMLVSSLEAFAGIYLTLFAAGRICRHEKPAAMFAYLGEASLFIFIFHAIIQGQATGILQHRLPDQPLLGAWIGFGAGLTVPLLIYEICRRSRLLSVLMLPYRGKRPVSANSAASGAGRTIQSSGS